MLPELGENRVLSCNDKELNGDNERRKGKMVLPWTERKGRDREKG